jgi:hypothetical protein
MWRQSAACLVLVLLGGALQAEILNKIEGKESEAEVIAAFEKGLSEFVAARIPESRPPRAMLTEGRREVFCQLVEVKGETTVWQELVAHGWLPESTNYNFIPHGPKYARETLKLPPATVADWFIVRFRLPEEILSLAIWLAHKGELTIANAKLAELAFTRTELREEVEAWLCAKHGWTRPESGLEIVNGYDFARDAETWQLLTPEARQARLRELEREADQTYRWLEDLQGKDVRSRPGQRRAMPQMRLDMLMKRVRNFEKAFAGTRWLENRRNKERLDKLAEVIQADLDFVTEESPKAERAAIDKNWELAAQHWNILWRTDPHNVHVILKTAAAYYQAAQISEGGRRAENREHAARAAELYISATRVYPLVTGYYNSAGTSLLATGDRRRAREMYEMVKTLTDGREDLSEADQTARTFALTQLEVLK